VTGKTTAKPCRSDRLSIVKLRVYWRAYVSEPSTRGLGFMMSMLPTVVLAILALLGIILALTGLKT
jgi:hypothetical protein